MTKPMNRRAAFGLFVAAPAAMVAFANGTPVSAAEADADLFALIAAGKHWWEQIGIYCTRCDSVAAQREGREVSPEDEEKLDEAHAEYQNAFDEAVGMAPQTVAGVRALLEWIDRDCDGLALQEEHVHALVDNLLASPVLSQAT